MRRVTFIAFFVSFLAAASLAAMEARSTFLIPVIAGTNSEEDRRPHVGVLGALVSANGTVLASISFDNKSISIWDLTKGAELATFPIDHSSSVALSADGNMLAFRDTDKSLKLWDVAHSKRVCELQSAIPRVQSIVFSANGRLLAVGCDDGTILIWDVKSLKRLGEISQYPFGNIAISPTEDTLAAAEGGSEIRLWDLNTLTLRMRNRERGVGIVCVAFSFDGQGWHRRCSRNGALVFGT